MTLSATVKNLVIDETTGVDLNSDDINPTATPYSTDPTVSYLLSLDTPSNGLPSPEVAFKQDFVVATANGGEIISGVSLSQDSLGTPFSTTVGVNSGVKTADGYYVWLFQDPLHPNAVLGVIGTSDANAAPIGPGAKDYSGSLAFSIALVDSSATNANLYTVQYVALQQPNTSDPNDQIALNLLGKIYASVAATKELDFSQLGDAPSGHNNWYILDADVASDQRILVTAHDNGVQAEVNVSTQGLGVASQDVRWGRELQIDLITGGKQSAGKTFTSSPTAPDYAAHIENVSSAGFSLSQATPTYSKSDIEIHAYNNDDNAKGAALPSDDNDAEINITGVTFKLNGVPTDASALGITVDLSGTGLILHNVQQGVTVDFTTAGGAGGTFDRFTIKNIDPEKDYFDVKEVHYSSYLASAYSTEVGSFIHFADDGPSISAGGAEPTLTVDESDLASSGPAITDKKSFAANFTSNYGNDGPGGLTYALSLGGSASGLIDSLTGEAVTLFLNGSIVEGRTTTSDALVFEISVNAAGEVTINEKRAVRHSNADDPNDSITLASDDLIKLTATITDKDGDRKSATLNIGQNFSFLDDGPRITSPLDADPSTAGLQTTETLVNTVNQAASGIFGYDLGADGHAAAYYTAGGSDFKTITLGGTVDNASNPGITGAQVTLASENASAAIFNWLFHYDADPMTAGVQDATAGGTLTFDKVNGTYEVKLTDVIDSYNVSIYQTSALVAKAPAGNTGQPKIVAEQLTQNGDPNPFFVQFTGNSNPKGSPFGFNATGDGSPDVLNAKVDTVFNQGQFVTSDYEDWVSATQGTNGVAGDTIGKGELLTLRFFKENILADVNPNDPNGGLERTNPTATADGLAIKFDGVGTSEDLMLVLDLKDSVTGNETTRAVYVQNSDLYKGGQVPTPYSSKFALDNNDALLVIESNDYNLLGEHYELQGLQIMQSGNGLTGNAIDLNGATGVNGGSSTNNVFNAASWDATDSDVLKITDIGAVQVNTGTIGASLNFGFSLADGDGDATALQNLTVNVTNSPLG